MPQNRPWSPLINGLHIWATAPLHFGSPAHLDMFTSFPFTQVQFSPFFSKPSTMHHNDDNFDEPNHVENSRTQCCDFESRQGRSSLLLLFQWKLGLLLDFGRCLCPLSNCSFIRKYIPRVSKWNIWAFYEIKTMMIKIKMTTMMVEKGKSQGQSRIQ